MIPWLTAFIDRPPETFEVSTTFWVRVAAAMLSPSRGTVDEFATLLPPAGDPYLRVQRVGDGGGSHLDLHVNDVITSAEAAQAVGATHVADGGNFMTMRSPAGFPFCIVNHRGERHRPPVVTSTHAGDWRVDQVCIDIPQSKFSDECAFWQRVTGWRCEKSQRMTQFARLAVPDPLPLRLLLQQRQDDDGPARCHLDIAANHRLALAAELEQLGASRVQAREQWIVMVDPAGFEFCLTGRDPHTGQPTSNWARHASHIGRGN